ncbi:MAG TPA: hypothetical protein VGE97_08630 [Nitrososphaera sp.]|jgi:hypothetical protein
MGSQTITQDVSDKSHDFNFFKEIIEEGNSIAGLYFFSTLDCLVDLAYRIAHDFFRRPHLYTDLGEQGDGNKLPAIVSILAKLHARYGSEEIILAKCQRDEIYQALFGKKGALTEDEGDFARLRNELVSACAAFAERVFYTGEDMLRERVRTTHRPFQEYLTGLLGTSVKWSRKALLNLTEEISYPILRNPKVAAVFGISKFPMRAWPYAEDSNADKLIEEMSKQLAWNDKSEVVNMGDNDHGKHITREQISNLQRAALRGAEALTTIIDYNESDDDNDHHKLHQLITKCYTWGSALLSLKAYPTIMDGRTKVLTGTIESRTDERRKGEIALAQPMITTSSNDRHK